NQPGTTARQRLSPRGAEYPLRFGNRDVALDMGVDRHGEPPTQPPAARKSVNCKGSSAAQRSPILPVPNQRTTAASSAPVECHPRRRCQDGRPANACSDVAPPPEVRANRKPRQVNVSHDTSMSASTISTAKRGLQG